jgi:hypothetical protein
MAWETKRILIVVRTYPTPSQKSIESSCTAGICDGKWIRLFPMPYRHLNPEQKFHKYQWVEMRVQKARNDPRIESYNPDRDSIKPLSTILPLTDQWSARKQLIYPLKATSLCELKRLGDRDGHPTLGFFKPKTINRLVIEPDESEWTSAQKGALQQMSLFDTEPPEELEKIPFRFSYDFECSNSFCKGHEMICTDWEMSELYRKLRRSHGNNWAGPFRQRYEYEMINRNETHFYVGTLAHHPGTWIVVGVFYPQLVKQMDLFEQH